jgi:DedD protein
MVVVFLPMVLDHEPRPVSQDINIQIPSPNSATYTSKIVPVVPGAPNPGGKTIVITPEPDAPAAAPAKSEARVQAPSDYDTEATPSLPRNPLRRKPRPRNPNPSPTCYDSRRCETGCSKRTIRQGCGSDTAASRRAQRDRSFVVQVAALNDAGKAKEMQEKMSAGGMKAYTEVVPTAKGSVTRVRAGPFATREEAEKMRDKLKDMGLPVI